MICEDRALGFAGSCPQPPGAFAPPCAPPRLRPSGSRRSGPTLSPFSLRPHEASTASALAQITAGVHPGTSSVPAIGQPVFFRMARSSAPPPVRDAIAEIAAAPSPRHPSPLRHSLRAARGRAFPGLGDRLLGKSPPDEVTPRRSPGPLRSLRASAPRSRASATVGFARAVRLSGVRTRKAFRAAQRECLRLRPPSCAARGSSTSPPAKKGRGLLLLASLMLLTRSSMGPGCWNTAAARRDVASGATPPGAVVQVSSVVHP